MQILTAAANLVAKVSCLVILVPVTKKVQLLSK